MPASGDDVRYGENMDPATYSINTIRGEAMHALIRYALWVRRHLEKEPNGEDRIARGFDEMPEVRSVLEKHLDPNQEPSVAIRAVYGEWLPSLFWLDRNWVRNNINTIFPREEALENFRNVAWEAYIIFGRPYNDLFDALLAEYRRAIERIGSPSQNWQHLGDPDSRLAEHLMIEFWWGHIDWEKPEGLMAAFYGKAGPKLRGWALEFVGRSLREDTGQTPPEVLHRLKGLWEKRIEFLRSAGEVSADSGELRSFAWWFVSKRFDSMWAIDQVRHVLHVAGKIDYEFMVAERLAELSAEMPARTVECLSMIVESDKDGWDILGWREHARTILSVAIKSKDSAARKQAVELVHRLAARGHSEFSDLVPSTSEQSPDSGGVAEGK